jgi:hypothetical protein
MMYPEIMVHCRDENFELEIDFKEKGPGVS